MRKIVLIALILLISILKSIAQTKTYVLATYTYSTNNRLQNLEPLADFLSQKTGLTIKAVSYPSVQTLISAIINDSVDFAMMNTSGYLVLQRNHPGKVLPLVNLDMGDSLITNYGGCLIATKQTGITSAKDLKRTKTNYSLALVNSSSTSGNLVPRLILNANGIADAEARFAVSYSGTHKKVVEDVLNGKAAIGGCGCPEVDSARKNLAFDASAIVIDSFNNIPLGPIVYRKKMDAYVIKAVANSLLTLHQTNSSVFIKFCDGWTEFKQAKRFKKVTDEDYNKFRKMFGNNKMLWKLIE